MHPDLTDIDHELHATLEKLVRTKGPVGLDWLTARARRARRDARIDDDTIVEAIETNTMLVWRPDGEVDHLVRVLDGTVLTQRVRSDLEGRTDLWATVSLQPVLNLVAFAPVRLQKGGEVSRVSSGQEVLLGPSGWLPPVPAYGVVGLRLQDEQIVVEEVDESAYPPLDAQQRVRETLAHHYRLERWYSGDDDLVSRPGEVVKALVSATLEVPDLLARPHPPLEELLAMHLSSDRDRHYWRDFAAQQEFTCGFWVDGMPEPLMGELTQRARHYGMSFDQYVIAVLGHLAWRTPFAEDLGPWERWDPRESGESSDPLRHMRPA